MAEITEAQDNPDVDKSLVAMFLRMSPEERLKSNDNAVRTILELRNAYQQQKSKNHKAGSLGFCNLRPELKQNVFNNRLKCLTGWNLQPAP